MLYDFKLMEKKNEKKKKKKDVYYSFSLDFSAKMALLEMEKFAEKIVILMVFRMKTSHAQM